MVPKIVEVTKERLKIGENQTIEIQGTKDVQDITSEAIASIFFGIKASQLKIGESTVLDEIGYLIRSTVIYSHNPLRMVVGDWSLYLSSDYRTCLQRCQNVRKFFEKIIIEKMEDFKSKQASATLTYQEDEQKDLIRIFSELQSSNDEMKSFTNSEILDEFFTFFTAGKDTTSSLITMALYYYVRTPEWRTQLEAEVNEAYQKDANLKLENINQMRIMDAFLKECLRMVPPLPFSLPRMAVKDHNLGDLKIKKGTMMFSLFLSNHFNEKYFKDPEVFNPGRFLETNTQEE